MVKKYVKKFFVYSTYLLSAFSFFGGNLYAEDDLLRQIMEPAVRDTQTVIDVGKSSQSVGNKIIKGSTEIDNNGVGSSPSIIVKITRFLLILTIALSVTMILYNGMIYIIQTGQGKEGKSLIKNVGLIVVGILISLFSVVIINLIQSIPTTLEEELDESNKSDTEIIKGKKMSWGEARNKIKKVFKSDKGGEGTDENILKDYAIKYFTGCTLIDQIDSSAHTGCTITTKSDGTMVIKFEDGSTKDLVDAFIKELYNVEITDVTENTISVTLQQEIRGSNSKQVK